MKLLTILRHILTIIIFTNTLVLSQGKVYLVLGSDTAIWDVMSVTKYNSTYKLDLFTSEASNTAVVMSDAFREPMVDSYGNKIKFTWWMMAGNVFRYATNNNVPINNTMTLYLMKKYYGDKIKQWGDELSLHYHTFAWTDYDNDGIYYWNQAKSFLETKDDFDYTLAQYLLEENVFPVSFRSGWHYMDNDWQNYLNTLLPYNLDNDWPSKRLVDEEPIDNIYDWSQASSEFVPYHPSPDNYQLAGNSKAWNVRSYYMGYVKEAMVNDIFSKASAGKDQLVCFWSHLPDQNFTNEIQQVNNIVQQVAVNYPGVKFQYCTAAEGYKLWQKSNDNTNPELSLTEVWGGSEVKFQVTTNEPIFQAQPFLAVKDRYERYFIAACVKTSANTWQTVSSYHTSDLAKVGVAVTDTLGNLSTSFINYLPDNKFIDNGDADYSEVYGSWTTSSTTAWGLDSRIANISPGDSAIVSWKIETGYSGLHNIFFQIPKISGLADTVYFRVFRNGAASNLIVLDLNEEYNKWIYITTVDLKSGENNYLQMSATNKKQTVVSLACDVLKISAYVKGVELTPVSEFVDLGEVSVEDTVDFPVVLKNTGINNLSVQNIYFNGNNISSGSSFPIVIEGMSKTEVPFRFIPDKQGSIEDTLFIVSNDPAKPVCKIPFTALVKSYFVNVDNDEQGIYSETGTWYTSVVQAYGPSSRFAYIQTTANGPSALFSFKLRKSGYYDVYEILPTTVNAANNALYEIIVNGTLVSSFYKNQNEGSGSWKYFGRYLFKAGEPVWIRVKDTGESTEGPVLRADAFKLNLYEEVTDVENGVNKNIPDNFTLLQNYPNPFNPATIINYTIPDQEKVVLKVFDVIGNEIATLIDKEQSAGNYSVEFSTSVLNLSSGIYFYRMQAGSFIETKKMILLK